MGTSKTFKTNSNRDFAEAMLRLRRDSLNLNSLGISTEELKLSVREINEERIVVTFDVTTNKWILLVWMIQEAVWASQKDWNPTIFEVTELLSDYDSDDIQRSIGELDELTNKLYSNVTAETLEPKFMWILHLITFEENCQTAQIEIQLKNNITYKLYYNPAEFRFEYYDIEIPSIICNFNRIDVTPFLENCDYLNASKALNKCYIDLVRKV